MRAADIDTEMVFESVRGGEGSLHDGVLDGSGEGVGMGVRE
jgi:hypothetical protein